MIKELWVIFSISWYYCQIIFTTKRTEHVVKMQKTGTFHSTGKDDPCLIPEQSSHILSQCAQGTLKFIGYG